MTDLSVIIPVLNEAGYLPATLQSLRPVSGVEIVVVDGGSQDGTADIAKSCDATVLRSPQLGRASQMNFGASVAIGQNLLFLHGDSRVPDDYFTQIQSVLATPSAVAGAFTLKIDAAAPIYRLLEIGINLRSHLFSLPYGDQGIFLKAERFRGLGGFANLPIMEDFEFIQRLKRQGKIAIASSSLITSGRRWQKLGIARTTWINQKVIAGYYLGVAPDKLARWYRSDSLAD